MWFNEKAYRETIKADAEASIDKWETRKKNRKKKSLNWNHTIQFDDVLETDKWFIVSNVVLHHIQWQQETRSWTKE